jgi:hypothetical protein
MSTCDSASPVVYPERMTQVVEMSAPEGREKRP